MPSPGPEHAPARVISINSGHCHREYRNNHASTTKYNVVTYLPKALFEQFRRAGCRAPCGVGNLKPSGTFVTRRARRRRVANIYFTLVAGVSCTSLSPVRCDSSSISMQCQSRTRSRKEGSVADQ